MSAEVPEDSIAELDMPLEVAADLLAVSKSLEAFDTVEKQIFTACSEYAKQPVLSTGTSLAAAAEQYAISVHDVVSSLRSTSNEILPVYNFLMQLDRRYIDHFGTLTEPTGYLYAKGEALQEYIAKVISNADSDEEIADALIDNFRGRLQNDLDMFMHKVYAGHQEYESQAIHVMLVRQIGKHALAAFRPRIYDFSVSPALSDVYDESFAGKQVKLSFSNNQATYGQVRIPARQARKFEKDEEALEQHLYGLFNQALNPLGSMIMDVKLDLGVEAAAESEESTED